MEKSIDDDGDKIDQLGHQTFPEKAKTEIVESKKREEILTGT